MREHKHPGDDEVEWSHKKCFSIIDVPLLGPSVEQTPIISVPGELDRDATRYLLF